MDLVAISSANEQNLPRHYMLMAPYVGSNWPQFLLVGEFVGTKIKVCRGSPAFSTMFSEGFLYRVIKSRDCVVKN